jgi:uncharacterized delta-60 repeat protein
MKYVFILFTFLIISSCKKDSAPETAPIINLKSPTEITENSITVNVELKGNNILNFKIIVSTDTNNFWNKASRELYVNNSGNEKRTIENLVKGTKYFLGVTATNNIGSSKSNIISFETLASLAKIIYPLNPILNLTGVSANLQYQISDYGGATILENGICWSINPNPTINDSKYIDTASKSQIDGILTNLNSNTKYFARAYVKNSVGVAYGAEISLTTLPNNTCFTKSIGLINPGIRDLKLTNDNKLFIVGAFNTVNGFDKRLLTRFNTDGSFTNDFNYNSNVFPNALEVLKDGKILVHSNQTIIKINSDGTIDPSFKGFSIETNRAIRKIMVLSDGKILVGGSFGTINGYNFTRLARLNTDGTIDESFMYKGIISTLNGASIVDVRLLSNGKLIIIGSGFMEKVNQNGTVDSSFNYTFRNDMYQGNSIQRVINMPDDKLLIVYSDLSQATKLIRINSDGSLDATFKSGLFGLTSLSVFHLLSDNKIMVGGNFSTYNGASVGNLIRLNQDGSIDNSFNSGLGFGNGLPLSIVQSNDGKIIIGGNFKLYRQKSVDGIVKINNDGTLCQ